MLYDLSSERDGYGLAATTVDAESCVPHLAAIRAGAWLTVVAALLAFGARLV